MELSELFNKCLRTKYTHTYEGGSWAVDVQGDTLYLMLQWSNGVVDWINNFDFATKPYKDMPKTWKAHRGFLRVWKSIEPEVSKYIMDKTVQKITIIGYSHGASVAVLAHEYCWYNRPDIRENIFGYGFEGARVFCGKMPEELKERWKNFTLIRNGKDIVTRVPPRLFGFKHCGNVLNINPKYIVKTKHTTLPCINMHYEDNVIYALSEYEKSKKEESGRNVKSEEKTNS